MRISRLYRDVIGTCAAELEEISKGLIKKVRESPLLYLWFSIILTFSVVMSARLTLYEMGAQFPIEMDHIFFAVFFLFMLKSSADFHRYFISSKRVEYLLALPISHFRVLAGIFFVIFLINLGLWTLFSSSYIFSLYILGVPIGYPEIYLKFTVGVVLSIIIGTGISVHYFSRHRVFLIAPILLITLLWYFHTLYHVLVVLTLSFLYLIFALRIAYNSFGFVTKKERKSKISEHIDGGSVEAIAWKETTVMWREKLISSFIFTSISVGLGSGYVATHMDISLIPLAIRPVIVPALPFIFLFLGIFIVASYLFVFPTLNAFLSEENTLWILRHLPMSGREIVKGKIWAMSLPLLASLPFPFYFIIFSNASYIYLGFSLLFFSFFLSTGLSLPFGIKYVGKKSDVMLLYTISVVLFVIFAIGSYLIRKLTYMGLYGFAGIISLLALSALLLMISLEISGRMMERRWE